MVQHPINESNNRSIAKIEVNALTKVLPSLPPSFQNLLSYDTKTKIEGDYDEPTLKLFRALQNIYNFFKTALFENRLGPVILTLNRNSRLGGYYKHSAWVDESQIILPEINISPAMLSLGPMFVTSILVHESCHQLQYLYGKPGRNRYHNKQFAKIMSYLGLMCSDTFKPGGKTTGQRMGHYIIEGGRFEQAYLAMPKEYLLPFTSVPSSKTEKEVATDISKIKIKYKCATCSTTLWGKPHQYVLCGKCNCALIEKS